MKKGVPRIVFMTALILTLAFVLAMIPARAEETAKKTLKKPLTGKYVRKSNRDPFIIGINPKKPVKTVKTIKETNTLPPVVNTNTPKSGETGPVNPPVTVTPKKAVEVESNLILTGVVKTPKGYSAIISSPGGKSIVVHRGDKLGEYMVTEITPKRLLMKTDGAYSIIKLRPDKKDGQK